MQVEENKFFLYTRFEYKQLAGTEIECVPIFNNDKKKLVIAFTAKINNVLPWRELLP